MRKRVVLRSQSFLLLIITLISLCIKNTISTTIENAGVAGSIRPTYLPVESMTLDKTDITLTAGEDHTSVVSLYPQNASDPSLVCWSDDYSVATVDNYGKITGLNEGSCTITIMSSDNNSVFAEVSVTVTAKPSPSLTYIDGILIANKTYPLPSDYDPGTDTEAYAALEEMFSAAAADGIYLFVCSGYRSYQVQYDLYNYYVWRDGTAAADRYSARPGHSEHQTGLAFDLNTTAFDFAGTPEANWIEANCHKYGFILRYPRGKEHITGYIYEPWHIRYIGKEKAEAVTASGLCLEEYLGITSVYG